MLRIPFTNVQEFYKEGNVLLLEERINLELEMSMRVAQFSNIEKLIQVYKTKESYNFIFEDPRMLHKTNLYYYIFDKKTLGETEARNFFIQILDIVSNLEKVGICYANIDIINFLVVSDEIEPGENQYIKLVNFSNAAFPIPFPQNNGDFNNKFINLTFDRSPEFILDNTCFPIATTVYTLGALLYRMLYGHEPFLGTRGRKYAALNNNENLIFHGCYNLSKNLIQLIQSCLKTNPYERPNFEEIYNHSWVRNFSDETINDKNEYVQMAIEGDLDEKEQYEQCSGSLRKKWSNQLRKSFQSLKKKKKK